MNSIKQYFFAYLSGIGTALSQLGSALLNRNPDITLSAIWARQRKTNKFANFMCSILDFIDPGHSDRAMESDKDEKEFL